MNVLQAIEKFIEATSISNTKSKIYSAIAKYIAPSWGYPYPEETKRMSPRQMNELKKFLSTVKIEKCIDMKEVFDSNTRGLSNKLTASYKTVISNFYSWCKDNKIIKDRRGRKKDIIFIPKKYSAKAYWATRKGKGNKRKPYKLMATDRDGLIHESDFVNNKLKKDFEEYKYFRKRRDVTKSSISLDIESFERFLGWLYRFKGVPLEELRLSNIIQLYELPADYHEDYYKLKVRRQLMEGTKKNLDLIDEYLCFMDNTAGKNSQKRLLASLTALAKFIYRDELNKSLEFEYDDDIFMVKKLRKKENSIKLFKGDAKSYDDRIIPWQKALEVLEILRINSLATHYQFPKSRQLINLKDKSRYMYYFIAVSLCMLRPPLRSSDYPSLKINELVNDSETNSILLGEYKNKKFLFKNQMDNPEEAKWYIRLQEYKTKKIYGVYWSRPIPNIQFKDGTFYYDYLEDWINNKRNYDGKCNHNFLLRAELTNKPLNEDQWHDLIVTRFLNYAFVPVVPNSLRHMYVTEVRNNRATEDEKIAVAYEMLHSKETASKTYNEQTAEEITAPAKNINNKILSSITYS